MGHLTLIKRKVTQIRQSPGDAGGQAKLPVNGEGLLLISATGREVIRHPGQTPGRSQGCGPPLIPQRGVGMRKQARKAVARLLEQTSNLHIPLGRCKHLQSFRCLPWQLQRRLHRKPDVELLLPHGLQPFPLAMTTDFGSGLDGEV